MVTKIILTYSVTKEVYGNQPISASITSIISKNIDCKRNNTWSSSITTVTLVILLKLLGLVVERLAFHAYISISIG